MVKIFSRYSIQARIRQRFAKKLRSTVNGMSAEPGLGYPHPSLIGDGALTQFVKRSEGVHVSPISDGLEYKTDAAK